MGTSQSVNNASLINTYMHYLVQIGDERNLGQRGYILAVDFRTEAGCRPQAGILKELFDGGFLERLYGRPFAYRLARPLSEMVLSELIILANPQKDSSLIRLLKQGSHLPLSMLKDVAIPVDYIRDSEAPYSFDFIIALAKAFSHESYSGIETIKGALGEFSYTYTYVIGAIGALYHCGLVSRKPHTGYLANKPFSQMTLQDIAPAITQSNTLLNRLLYLFRDCPLSQFV